MNNALIVEESNWLDVRRSLNDLPKPLEREVYIGLVTLDDTMQLNHAAKRFVSLKPGDPLRLQHDANNALDPYTVKVFADMDLLGYIPCSLNRIFARFLDAGLNIKCVVKYSTLIDNFIFRVGVETYLVGV